MTREDEITRIATFEYAPKIGCFNAFIEGAEYADRTMLDRACEWFELRLHALIGREDAEELIAEFRQAMEGGAE